MWSRGLQMELQLPSHSKVAVVVERLDGGRADEPGEYRCTAEACNWCLADATRYAATSHVYNKHKGCRCQIKRLVSKRVDIDQKRERSRLGCKRYRSRAGAANENPG